MVVSERALERERGHGVRVLDVERRRPHPLMPREPVDRLRELVRHAVVQPVGQELIVAEVGLVVAEVRPLVTGLHVVRAITYDALPRKL